MRIFDKERYLDVLLCLKHTDQITGQCDDTICMRPRRKP